MKLNYASLNNKEYDKYSIIPKIKEEYQQEEENIIQEESDSIAMQNSEEEGTNLLPKAKDLLPKAKDLLDQIRNEVISNIPEEENSSIYSNKPGKISISSQSTTKKSIGTRSKFLNPSLSNNKLEEEEIKSSLGGGLSLFAVLILIGMAIFIFLFLDKE